MTMKYCCAVLSAVLWAAFFCPLATAASPPNDHFADAIPLRGLRVTTTGSNADASPEAGEPFHWASTGGRSVWWTWTAPASGAAAINTFGSTFDTILAVYTGTAVSNLTLLANNDDASNALSRVEFTATAGTVYRIAVDGYGSSPPATGSITLNILGPASTPGTVSLVPTGSVWRYLDDGSDQGTAWREPGFNDAGWSNGLAQLGYGDGDEATQIRSNRLDSTRIVTTYFRKAFMVSDPAAVASLTVRLRRDDGAAVYLNGNEVVRDGLLPTAGYTNFATITVAGADETTYFAFTNISAAHLTAGTNVIAAEVHQVNLTSSDVSFDLELLGLTTGSSLPPLVILTSPPADATFATPGVVPLAADAWDDDGAITNVAFYAGVAWLGNDTTHPYSFVWSNVAAGAYALTAVATDNGGLRATSAVVNITVTNNPPPAVTLTSPTEGQSFVVPGNISLAADATDEHGISRVQFYAGTTLLGEAVVAPFNFTWSNALAGSHALRAVATDTLGARGTSAVVNITVSGNYPPTVALTSPPDQTTFSTPASVFLAATASDYDGTVTLLEFFAGAVKLGEATASPYQFTWTNAPVGSQALTAVATDNVGAKATSAVVNVTILPNTPPTVSLTSPTNGARFSTTDSISLEASASDANGSVVLVEFFSGASKLAEATAAPFRRSWTNPPAGLHLLTAVATDNGGLRATSAPVQITVLDAALLSGGLEFDGVNDYVTFGAATNTLGLARFTLETWFNWKGYGVAGNSGSGGVQAIPLICKGRGEADGNNLDCNYFFGILPGSRTLAADFEDLRPTSNNNPVSGLTPITTNIWHHAAVTYDGTNWALYFDGLLETNLFSGQTPRFDSLQHASLASALNSTGVPEGAFAGVLDEVRIWNYARTASEIASNRNLQIAAAPGLVGRWALDEKSGLVANDSSGGGTHGTLVNGPIWTLGNAFAVPPGVALVRPSEGAVIYTPTNATLEASAVDPDGTVISVDFFAGANLLGTVTAEPFTFGWVNPLPGLHTLRAVATDNMGLVSTSAPVNVRVENAFVQFTSPTNGARFIAPDLVPLAVNVSDAGGTITLVEFFAGTTKVGEASSPPFSANWTSTVGDFVLTAVATASGGLRHTSAPIHITVAANVPPTVALVAPGNGVTYYVPAVVNISASASDSDGSVAQVQFFANSILLSTDTAPPFHYNWTNAPLGAHALRAIATDDRGLTATSSVVNITVTTNTPPIVAITSPPNGAALIAPANVTLQASASDADGVASVEYFEGATRLGQATAPPYTVAWNGVLAGEYQLRAVATDGFGLAATSAVVSIRVTNNTPPVVALVAPTNNSSFSGPTNIILEATASDDDGIARVDFFQSQTLLGFATAQPWRMTWFSVPGGNYLLTAVATDGAGVRATSAPVNIVVTGSLAGTNALISFGARWNYLDDGSDQGTAWRAPGFDDRGWSNGLAQLGYGNSDEITVVGFGPNPNNKYPTTYFRHAFVVNHAAFNFLNLRLLYDDGAVVYLNGTEIYRTPTMPGGAINYLTYTLTTSENNAIATVNSLPNLLVPGTNVVAVEIHQANATSSDISFDFELAGVVTNTPPVVFLTDPPQNATLTAPTNVTLTASASDSDGSVALVEFFVGSSKIGQATAPPYTANWSFNLGGSFALRAVATDNLGLRATSAVVNVTVIGNLPPTVSLISPPPNRAYVIPTNIWLEASASDPDGTIASVQFYADSALLATDTAAPFNFDWSVSALGTFFLTAVATDDAGASATSAPVRITFVSEPSGGSLVNTGAIWKYFDTVTNEMPGWNTLGYDDSAWPSGPAELGYGDAAQGRPEATVVGWGPNANNKYITTCFRHTFAVPDPALYRSLFVRLLRDDGGIVYLNGVEVFRSNMPEGPVTINTRAASATDDGTIFFTSPPLAPGLLRAGHNVVAVEIHQDLPTSSDISFDLELIGNTTNARPVVSISSPASETVFTTPADITIAVSASDSDGTVTNVAFYAGETLLAQDAFAPFSYIWSGAPLGTHQLWAVATDNFGDSATSSVVRVYVVASTAPTVSAWFPPPGTVSNLTQVTVEFSEPVDGVNAADLLINGVPASMVQPLNASTYLFTFPQPADGPVSVAWAVGHGIADREAPPKPFLGTGAGETALYTLADTVPPQVVLLRPAPGATLRAFAEVEVTFSEAVSGVMASNLLLNGVPARKVTGSLAGPYVFEFTPPASNGLLQLAWATNQNIRDFASAQNRFAGGGWSYALDSAAPEGSVVINEIMYHPASENTREEFIELFNRSAVPINLTGWQLTGGVDFTFPAAVISAGGYLVVAADLAAFQAKYPTVTNVVGGWSGRLSNSDDDLRLRNALGDVVNRVHYATEGDWAIRQRGPNDLGTRGWEWFAAHDGNVINTSTGQNEGNRSLELMNPALPSDNGQNWAASLPANGTPGQRNSTATNNVPPLIYDVAHFPPVPKSTEPVTISARVADEVPGVLVQVFYRDASTVSPPDFASATLFDDGLHGDGLAGDGVYAAQLPALPNRTIVEYYLAATDDDGATRTWPAPARLETGVFVQQANAAYQVDDEVYTGGQPIYRLVLTAAELAAFDSINRNSDAEMNATFISVDGVDTKVRHNCGMRIRGAGTRGANPPNLRINVPADRRWNGLTELNLNSQYTHAQLVGSVFSLKSGMPCAAARAVQLRYNGSNRANSGLPQYGHYVFVEPIGGEWAGLHFPDDPNGNVYRGSRYPWTANLSYRGTNPSTYINEGYSKTSNQSDNDWTDLFALTFALNDSNSPGYVQGVQQNANTRMFMRFFAVCTLLDYMETSMCRGVGDDYAMYRGVNDPRFLLIPHDFDTILGQGDSPGIQNPLNTLWPMLNPPTSDPTMRANYLFTFMRHPEFAPLYYEELLRLLDTTYNPAQMSPMLDSLLGSWAPDAVPPMKTFVTNRYNYALSQIPTALTITHSLSTQNGYLYTATPHVTLRGRSHAARTRSVRVAGALADWSAFDAAWTNTVTLQPGLNRVLVQALDTNRLEFARATVEIWYDDGSVQNVSGTIATDTLWTAAGGPFNVTATLTVASGATLTLQPGTTVYLGSGVNLTVANGGRLLAEGTETAPIRFTRAPGASTTWGGITIAGGPGSPETRLVHAHIEFNNATAIQSTDGTVFLANLTFGNTARQYVSLDRSSFVVQDCVFPATTASFEPVHGNGGIKAGGRGLFLRNFFGPITGYNDTIDFSGGQRPGPIVQFINNVFMGTGDDFLDLDNTDAWVEGNIFLHAHKNGSPDTSSAVSGGDDTGNPSDITIIGNLIYDCDHAANAKQGNFYTMLHNTIVRQTHVGGLDTEGAVVVLADNGMTEGRGIYLEGNIIDDAEALTREQVNALVTFTNNLMNLPWTGPGGGNVAGDPLFKYVPAVAETTNFTSWAAAQVLWDWFSLRAGSPAQGAGPNGRDLGAALKSQISNLKSQRGVSISGEPFSPTPQTSATLTVGLNRTGNGILPSGWPAGSGFTHYRWRLDGGAWSAETPLATPIHLTGLAVGPHYVEVVGRNDAGLWQDDPALGADAVVTFSRTWTVDPNASSLRLNEVLARNDSAVPVNNRFPDLVELFNAGPDTLDLTGFSLTDDKDEPRKFAFPPGASLGAGKFLVLYADSENTPVGYHLGFALKQAGDDLYLFAPDGRLLDSVAFGPQLPDLSVGRMAGGGWALTQPTFGAANVALPTGDPLTLKLNEWLAASAGQDDFIELFNPDPLPVDLAGLLLTDTPESLQNLDAVPPLSFIPGGGFFAFIADGNNSAGPEHLNFRLAGEQGLIGLFAPDLSLIDCIAYGPQSNNVSQGRSPNGAAAIVFFAGPTPGLPNYTPPPPPGLQLVINEVLAKNIEGLTNVDGSTPEWIELLNPTAQAITLTGMSLTDTSAVPRKFVFPAGVALAAGARLTVLCDGSLPASSNTAGLYLNTGFGIKANGGVVHLYHTLAQGGGLLDEISYGVQAKDFSIGRVPDGSTNWVLCLPSAGAANVAVAALGDPGQLRVNEWMADPVSGSDWFELYNPQPQPVALGGLWLTDDVSTLASRQKSQIRPLSFIGTGLYGYERFLADNNPNAGPDHVAFALSRNGEALGVSWPDGSLIDGTSFGPQLTGVSEGRLPDGAATLVKFTTTPTPGDANYLPLTNIVINEVLTATPAGAPLEDAIELLNTSGVAVDLSGWWLSDARRELKKYRLPDGLVLPAGGFVVFYESNSFNALPDEPTSFQLSGTQGDEVYLSPATPGGALTGYRASVEFGAAEPGVSFGRYTNSVGQVDFVALRQRTFGADNAETLEEFRTGAGAPNAYPRVGPIVFNEVMYHPPNLAGADNVRDEFLELFNPSATEAVPLFDPAHPQNTWRLRGGVDLNFPTGLTLPPGGYLLVVSFNPVEDTNALAGFRAAYNLAGDAILVGPYSGKLDNGGESIELRRPGAPVPAGQPDAGYVPYIVVERVTYDDVWPWDSYADGTGWSLHRLDPFDYGNDPNNWLAGPPTPGPQGIVLDGDHDGMLDAWERDHGLNPNDPADAAQDPDGDGLTNLEEFRAGTDPRDPASVLKLAIALGSPVTLQFLAQPNRTYVLEYRNAVDTGAWTVLQNFATGETAQWVQYNDAQVQSPRFYRLRLP